MRLDFDFDLAEVYEQEAFTRLGALWLRTIEVFYAIVTAVMLAPGRIIPFYTNPMTFCTMHFTGISHSA